jgi:hypothetical protein
MTSLHHPRLDAQDPPTVISPTAPVRQGAMTARTCTSSMSSGPLMERAAGEPGPPPGPGPVATSCRFRAEGRDLLAAVVTVPELDGTF